LPDIIPILVSSRLRGRKIAGGRSPSERAEAKVRADDFSQLLRKALCGLPLVCAAVSSTVADDARPLTSIMIVSRAKLPDPYFADSVILVMNDLADGPVGIIVNRPTEIPVSHLFPNLERIGRLRDKLYFGGPVDPDSVWFVFRAESGQDHAIKACDGVYLSGDRDLLMKLLRRDKPMEGLKILLGHAGWAPGQLQGEIDRGDWTSKRADADAIFKSQPEHPWPASDAEPGNST
jgi:putative transcriptional regulator